MGTRPGSKPSRATPRTSKEMASTEPKRMKQASAAMKTRRGAKAPPINLKAVAEVLNEYGLNPAVMIVEAVNSGKLDEKTKAGIGLSLIEYLQPKLKAVDHKIENKLTEEQVNQQLEALLAKVQKK